MIITLADAQLIDPAATQVQLDSFESSIRQLTHNNFQLTDVRAWGVTLVGETATFKRDKLTAALKEGDTLQLSCSNANDGLYTVQSIDAGVVTLDRAPRLAGDYANATMTLVEYPADVKEGVRKLIAYDKKMAAKAGIKSETISRMSVTYYDVTKNESEGGYPANLMSFIKKYMKMYWG